MDMDILNKLKRMVIEPKVYALVVSSSKGQVLHLGVHFSLEEAYTAARKRMGVLTNNDPSDAVDIELWNILPARKVIADFMDPVHINIDETIKAPKNTQENITQPVSDNIKVEDDINGGDGVIRNDIPDISELPPILQQLIKKTIFMPINEFNFPSQMSTETPISIPTSGSTNVELLTTVSDHIQDMKDSKNDLMKKLIDEGDVAQVKKLRGLLGANSSRYVLNNIREKGPKKTKVSSVKQYKGRRK